MKMSEESLTCKISKLGVTDTSSLCPICQNISVDKMRGPDLDQMQPHQPSYHALKRSAEAGCQLCKYICIALCNGNGDESTAAFAQVCERYPGREISLVAWGGAERNFDRIHVITTGEPDDGEEVEGEDAVDDPSMHPDHQIALGGVLEIYTHPGMTSKPHSVALCLTHIGDDLAASHGPINGRVNGRPLPTTPGDSTEDFAMIKQWLSTCCTEHSHCRKPDLEIPLPTRVIDVGPPDGSLEPVLLESKDMIGLYVTLSHCWGGRVASTTTSKNVEEHKCGIPMDIMEKHFNCIHDC